jgi:hypothetical protein
MVSAILPAGLLSADLVRRLLLASFVLHDALLRARSILWLWHPCLAAVFPAHVLTPFKIVRLRHCLSPRWVRHGNAAVQALVPETKRWLGLHEYRHRDVA